MAHLTEPRVRVRHVHRLAVVLAALSGCTFRGGNANAPATKGPTQGSATRGPGPVGMVGGASNGAAARPEAFHLASARQSARALMYLPGSAVQRLVSYQVVDGMAVLEGDIILGPASTAPLRYGVPATGPRDVYGAVALASKAHFWPRSQMPYVIDPSAAGKREWIEWAVSQMSATALNLRPRTAADTDYVVFQDSGDSAGCSSYLGRIGGSQEIETGGCGRGSIIHEILHAAGFYHEQSRGDRDEFITINWNEIDPSFRDQFEKRDERGQDVGGYDYDSIMHYSRKAFSQSGQPTLIPKNPAAKIGQRDGLSVGDRDALAVLYGTPSGPRPAPPQPPPSSPPGAATRPAVASGFAGTYSSQRGAVLCSQSSATVNCQFPGGGMLCTATAAQLDCAWSGGGSGRALFMRQPNGVVAGTYGDFLSTNSRGAWDLVPAGGAPPTQPAPAQPAPTQPAPLPATFPIPAWPFPAWPLPAGPPAK